MNFVDKIFEINSENEFNELALSVFRYQYENIPIYNTYINSRKISFRDKSLSLTERETNLIIFIKDKKNVTIKELQKMVWDYSPDLDTHTVETHIYRLRKKMKETFGDKDFILNTSNGYSMD